MANMDALSILALGLAQSSGGGGGTSDYSDLSNKPQINNVTLSGNKSLSDLGIPTYTAGDNVTISNNEISVEGLELEQDSQFVQDAVNHTDISGGTVSVSSKTNGIQTKSITLNGEASTINGEDQSNYKMWGVSADGIWFDEFNTYDRTVTIAPNDNYTGIKVRGKDVATTDEIPQPDGTTITESNGIWSAVGGGSSSGAVRYDQAQVLTDAEKNQAKANQELPYINITKVNVVAKTADNSIASDTSAKTITKYPTVTLPSSGITIGAKVYLTVEDSGEFSETIEGVWETDTGYFSANVPDDSLYFKSGEWTGNSRGILSSSNARWFKKDTSGLTIVNPCYYTFWADNYSYENKMPEKLVNSPLLQNSQYKYDVSMYTGWFVAQPNTTNYPINNANNAVFGVANKTASNTSGAIIVGDYNEEYQNCSAYALIGSHNATGKSYSQAPNKHNSLIGYYLLPTQSQYSTVIGKFNKSTSKYLPYNSTTTYNQGDCVTRWASNSQPAVYRCLANNTTGQNPPSSGTGNNEYWEYVDNGSSSGYAFVIGNGVGDDSQRSNALTVDWSGNLVCNNIPECPSADGTYNLQVTISSGVPTYSWVAQV